MATPLPLRPPSSAPLAEKEWDNKPVVEPFRSAVGGSGSLPNESSSSSPPKPTCRTLRPSIARGAEKECASPSEPFRSGIELRRSVVVGAASESSPKSTACRTRCLSVRHSC